MEDVASPEVAAGATLRDSLGGAARVEPSQARVVRRRRWACSRCPRCTRSCARPLRPLTPTRSRGEGTSHVPEPQVILGRQRRSRADVGGRAALGREEPAGARGVLAAHPRARHPPLFLHRRRRARRVGGTRCAAVPIELDEVAATVRVGAAATRWGEAGPVRTAPGPGTRWARCRTSQWRGRRPGRTARATATAAALRGRRARTRRPGRRFAPHRPEATRTSTAPSSRSGLWASSPR